MTILSLSRILLPWLMLLALFMGVLNGAKTASTANSFLADESLAAHMRNPLGLLKKSGFDQKDTSGASVATKGGIGFNAANLESKLSGYLLNPAHPQNQTKATWFNQALGFDQSNWQGLAKQLHFDPAKAVPTKATQYGQTFEQVIPIVGTNGKTVETTVVFMKDNYGTVRFVTGIPAKK